MTLDKDLQTVNWPAESDDYKVVQLDVDGKPYLRFREPKYVDGHGPILFIFLETLEIPYENTRGTSGAAVPALEGDRYKVHGMGRARVDVEQKQARLYGKSDDYGIRINPEHLEAVKQLVPDWNISIDYSLE